MVRHVVFIVIDCLRADHVSSYGYHRETTPTLDTLASQGILWENVSSVSSWTKPSVASLFTGLYPSQHGACRGIKRSKDRPIATTDVLASPGPTLAEAFSAARWRTGAFANNAQLDPYTRLDRGFETYRPRAGNADRIIAEYVDWLRGSRSKPSLAYLHFLEAHWPYKPRRRHIAMFGGNRDTNTFRDFSARDYGRLRREITQGSAILADDSLAEMVQMYDGAVRRLDGKVKIILNSLRDLGLREETAVVVTADHGEEFLDHGTIGHGHTLYNELTHVPLVASIPGGPMGVRFSDPVSQVNLPRTLLGVAGIQSEFPGHDLTSSSDGSNGVFSELRIRNRLTQTIRVGKWKLHRRQELQSESNGGTSTSICPTSTAVEGRVCHYELYDLQSDPHEQEDVSKDTRWANVSFDLKSKLDEWCATTQPTASQNVRETPVKDQVLQRIRDLGYID